jgi:glucose uptake protein GlcU
MQIATLFIQSKQLDIKISKYCKKVVLPTVFSSVVALAIPTFMYLLFQPGIIRFIVSILSSVISTLCTFYALGIEKQERQFINEIIIRKILKK